MKRLGVAFSIVALSLFAPASAAPTRVSFEIWGVGGDDTITIDGAAVNVRAGGAPRVFQGDPDATNAPVLHELAPGKHEIVLKHVGCAPRTFTVSLEGSTKRALVLEPMDAARCAVPFAPPRR